MMVSVNSPNSSIRVHGGRTRYKTASTKRSGSGDERRYTEHLEGEEPAVQGELTSVAQEHTLRMNRMSAENRMLQAQLKDWEMRYDEEVRDFVQQHNVVEMQLRSKNTNLEDYASKAKDRVAELESQVQKMQQALEGAEAANVQLERRIEIMSELLTASPAKADSCTDAPARRRMQPRPRSMLPRASNHRGSWIGSPERTPDFGALSSPAMSFTQPREGTPETFEPLERIVSRGVWSSSSPHQPSERDNDELTPSVRSSIFSDYFPAHEPNQTKSRPHRRMRRFGGGSNGPKPLILPYATHVDPNTMTAPPLDRHETAPSLPFRRSMHLDTLASPSYSRPRAATSASEHVLRSAGSSETREQFEEAGFQRILSLAQQSSNGRAYSFVSTSDRAGFASRNLFDELHAAKTDGPQATPGSANDELERLSRSTTLEADDQLFMIPAPVLPSPATRHMHTQGWETESLELSPLSKGRDPFNPALESIMGPLSSTSPDSESTPKAITNSRLSTGGGGQTTEESSNLSALDRVRHSFGDLLRSPADLARMIVHATQQRMHVPAPLLSVQWWVVGLLWGPMARRRMLQYSCASNDEDGYKADAFASLSPSLAVDESLAYGTVYTSPVSGLRRRAGMAGPGKRRGGNTQHCTKETNLLTRHNPLLWVKFSITLAYAVGVAFTSGPGSLLPGKQCSCASCKNGEQ